jgi:uncharacterized protein (DUF2235 family)
MNSIHYGVFTAIETLGEQLPEDRKNLATKSIANSLRKIDAEDYHLYAMFLNVFETYKSLGTPEDAEIIQTAIDAIHAKF